MTETWRFQKRTRKHSEKKTSMCLMWLKIPLIVCFYGLILDNIIYFVPTNVTQQSFTNWKNTKKWS